MNAGNKPSALSAGREALGLTPCYSWKNNMYIYLLEVPVEAFSTWKVSQMVCYTMRCPVYQNKTESYSETNSFIIFDVI